MEVLLHGVVNLRSLGSGLGVTVHSCANGLIVGTNELVVMSVVVIRDHGGHRNASFVEGSLDGVENLVQASDALRRGQVRHSLLWRRSLVGYVGRSLSCRCSVIGRCSLFDRSGCGLNSSLSTVGVGVIALRRGTAQPELRGASRPSVPALLSEDALADRDLLLTSCLVSGSSVFGSAVCRPGGRCELQTTLEAVASVDAPVATRLALS